MYWIRRILSKCFHIYYRIKTNNKCVIGRILMVHNVGGKENGLYNLTVEDFIKLLVKLKGYNVVKLEEWETADNFVAITVDDVPRDFYYNAFPLLKKFKIPFTLFVATSLLDKEGYITTDQLKEFSSCELCTIGSHGIYHGEYTLLTKSDKIKELKESRNILESITGCHIDMYAFPYGSMFACGYSHKKIVRKFYKYGFGTVQVPVTRPMFLPKYYIPRINVSSSFINNFYHAEES